MCLGVPARIVEVSGVPPLRSAVVEQGDARRTTRLTYLPEADVGDWVLLQNGFAVTLLDEESARESLALFGELLDEMGAGPTSS
ncbi:HypC/HybG/HupF family hydrogenase formation chaperone [Nocardioides sp. GY 10127]|uniref:HypC/HybG/HupF family hydrogenase formation chaperone n=1 Tax=Nocardioides sp. GY 10127 TaxID=2569762 RepID=UPI0010A818DE|nr:HypC/HybG/HupF family hydrogenase formation chaperone [Nocardioides sp. GY 10127]TIC80203.1 HypC/HybG/HupF family hydrogenase formation chaperone [Nocardioides sp. GY 10127]